MRVRHPVLGVLAAAWLILAACSASPGVGNVESVRQAAEQATGVDLVDQPLSAELQGMGVVAYLGNASSFETDRQTIQIYIADSDANSQKVRDEMTISTAGVGLMIITHKRIVVLYGVLPGGSDNGARLKGAVESL